MSISAKWNESKPVRYAVVGAVALAATLVVFRLGVLVGYKKSVFSDKLSCGYSRTFAPGPRAAADGDVDADDSWGSVHGAAGRVASVATSSIVVADRGGVEKLVLMGERVEVRSGLGATTSGAIRSGDVVVVLGYPDERGRIVAELVRIMPPVAVASATAAR